MKKILATIAFGFVMVVSSVNAHAGTLNIVWDSAAYGYGTYNINEQFTLNSNGTWSAGAFSGEWWSSNGTDVSLWQTGGPSCSSSYSSLQLVLEGSMTSSNPVAFSGLARCTSLIFGGTPPMFGSWSYQ